MKWSTVATVLAFLAIPTMASAHAGNPDPNMVHACIGNGSNIVRIVGVSDSCRPSETPAHWAIQGQQGAPGTNGTNGIDGTNGTNGTNGAPGAPAPSVAVRATHSVTQQWYVGTVKILSFDSEVFDTANVHDADADNSRLTAPVDGVYQITVNVLWGQQALTGLQVIQNGTTVVAQTERMTTNPGLVGYLNFQHLSTLTKLSAGDFVEVGAFSNAAGGIAYIFGTGYILMPEFSMALVAGT